MERNAITLNLDRVLKEAPVLRLDEHPKLVIMSDLHMGNGGRNDDFLSNSALVMAALERYYLAKRYTLVLNGDIEELQRFPLASVRAAWPGMYAIFDAFASRAGFVKLAGNHDLELLTGNGGYPYPVHEALRLSYRDASLSVFHGHQASRFFASLNGFSGLILRYVANPLGIGNFAVPRNSRTRFRTEKRIYEYSIGRRTLSIVGHTHRPLFESLSRRDSLRYRIERECRKYPSASAAAKVRIRARVEAGRAELQALFRRHPSDITDSLYTSPLLIPCLFNSGCGIGKRGITAIEIRGDEIRLVHWFDSRKSRKYLDDIRYSPKELDESGLYRAVLKRDSLDYILARISLLT